MPTSHRETKLPPKLPTKTSPLKHVGRSWSSWKELNPPLLQPCKVGIHIWSLGPIRIFWKPKKPDGLDGKRPWDERVGFFGISGSEKKVLVFDESLQVHMILCRRNGGFQRFCTFQCDSIIVFFDILLNDQISRNHVRATCQIFRPQCLQW